ISVTSHFHFFEANPRLRFDRSAAYGMHLAVAAGSAVRFEPGATRPVGLVPIGGRRGGVRVPGAVGGPAGRPRGTGPALEEGPGLRVRRFGSGMNGPTAGDLIELADTGLVIRVEADAEQAGDEFRTGFGKTARDGMHLRAATASDTCDVVVTNVTLLDPVLG